MESLGGAAPTPADQPADQPDDQPDGESLDSTSTRLRLFAVTGPALGIWVAGGLWAVTLLASSMASTTWLLCGVASVLVGAVAARAVTARSSASRATSAAAGSRQALVDLTRERDQLQAQMAELQRLALHDAVTGLGNRVLLQHRGVELGAQLSESTLLLLDLDGFKEVNDTLGHALGDGLLRMVGERLRACVRLQDTVVRLGGDEFVVLLPETSSWHALRTAERILEGTRRSVTLAGQSVQVRASIGIAYGSATADLDEMLHRADVAMYAAKGAGRDQCCEYDETMIGEVTERFKFDAEMRQGLRQGEFQVYYQPIVEAQTQRVVSLEALVRWERAGLGVVSPSDFLPAAERSGLIIELGQFVLRTACEQTAQWRRRWPELKVAVNASHRELMDAEFAPQVAGVLASTGLSADALCVEVTETVLAAEQEIENILRPLHSLGVRSSLDDFGTGHSSLSRLNGLKVDRVKIDRSFVMDIVDESSPGAALLGSIIGLAHSVGLAVIAEGVETSGQAEFLAAHGCEEMQGYLFSRPMPAAQVAAFIEADVAARAARYARA